jgi:hypothetical protein
VSCHKDSQKEYHPEGLNDNQISDSRNNLSPKVDDNACVQQPHFEHEYQDKKTELEYLAQQVPDEEH